LCLFSFTETTKSLQQTNGGFVFFVAVAEGRGWAFGVLRARRDGFLLPVGKGNPALSPPLPAHHRPSRSNRLVREPDTKVWRITRKDLPIGRLREGAVLFFDLSLRHPPHGIKKTFNPPRASLRSRLSLETVPPPLSL
jgi:hypothetical protein